MNLLSRMFRKSQTKISKEAPAKHEPKQQPSPHQQHKPQTTDIAKQHYGPELVALCSDAQTAHTRRSAQQRIATCLDNHEVGLEQVQKDFPRASLLVPIVSLCQQQALLEQTLATIDDETTLATLCPQLRSSAARKHLITKISSKDALRLVQKQAKNKDKVSYKAAKEKLALIKDQEKSTAQAEHTAAQTCELIAAHSAREFDKDFIPRLNQLKRHWSQAENAANHSQRQQYLKALALCEETVDKHREQQQIAQSERDEKARVHQHREQLFAQIKEFIIHSYQLEDINDATKDSTARQLAAFEKRWQALTKHGKPKKDEQKNYTTLYQSADALYPKLERIGTLKQVCQHFQAQSSKTEPENLEHVDALADLLQSADKLADAEIPQQVKQAQALIESHLQAAKQQAQKSSKAHHSVLALLKKSKHACKLGHLKQALGIRHSINEKLANIGEINDDLQEKIQQLDDQIEKLVDWQNYAVKPKKEALIAQMEKLVHSQLAPPELAQKISELQKQWKALKQSGKDRNEELWERFYQAMQAANAPCKRYFDAQAKQREDNLAKRKHMTEQLQDYYQQQDWLKADWSQVEKLLTTARKEWFSYSPVERGANRTAQEAFDKAMAAIQEKLQQQYHSNQKIKEMLIDQAKKLSDIKDTAQSTETAKRLQAQWKTIGSCGYKQNQAMWNDFRSHCNAVFDKQQQEFQGQQASRDTEAQKAYTIIENLEKLSAGSLAEQAKSSTEKEALISQFETLGELPQKKQASIQKRFTRAIEKIDATSKRAQQKLQQQKWDNLLKACTRINEYEGDNNQAACEGDLEALKPLPESGANVIEARLNLIKASSKDDDTTLQGQNRHHQLHYRQDNQKALALLCIQAEILANIESPASDKAARMEYQISALQQSFGKSGTNSAQSKHSLLLTWLSHCSIACPHYQALYQRFQHALSRIE